MKCAHPKSLVFSIVVFFILNTSALWAVQDTFTVQMGPKGEVLEGGGSGYGEGQWYYYPNSEWWNQWFYNGPYDPDRKKNIRVSAVIWGSYTGAPGYAEVAVNYSTGQWPSGTQTPPLPESVSSPSHENKVIYRSTIFEGEVTNQRSINVYIEIPSYCPEWVSIDIRGMNVTLQ